LFRLRSQRNAYFQLFASGSFVSFHRPLLDLRASRPRCHAPRKVAFADLGKRDFGRAFWLPGRYTSTHGPVEVVAIDDALFIAAGQDQDSLH